MKKFKVSEEVHTKIKFLFNGYVFNRKDAQGCFVKLNSKQRKICESMNLEMEEL